MQLDTLTLGPAQMAVLRSILDFHLSNDQGDEGYYDREAFLELCSKAGVKDPSPDALARAAAKDMLAALKHLVHWHDQLSREDIARAEAAIRLAETGER